MTKKTFIAITAAFSLAMPALIAAESRVQENHGQLSEKDYKFVTEAARGGMAEVRLGQLAKQKATSSAVRDFAQRMIADHSKANEELSKIAASKNATLPADLSHKETSHLETLQKTDPKDFDKEYAEHMVKDHKKDLKEFQEAAKELKDPDLRAFAEKTTATIQEHLSSAEQLEASLKKE